jgi:uncharacterized membrane protein YcaP (DUF421 family)
VDPQELLIIAGRATIVYVFLLLVVRLLGKREIGSISAFDLIVALILGEMVDEAIFGDVTLLQYGVATVTIAAWHFLNSLSTFKSKTLSELLGGKPTLLVRDGKILHDALAKERLHEDELRAELRLMGVDDIKEVKKATLETSGKISLIQQDWAKGLQKGDLKKKVV